MKHVLYAMLVFCFAKSVHAQADSARLRSHVTTLTRNFGNRDYTNTAQLDSVATFLSKEFHAYADSVYEQPYRVNEKTYRNVVAVFGDTTLPVIVIGAHYDVCEMQEGADDNASGVVGLLELARLLDTIKLQEFHVELVAYTLEEPPYFRTEKMGSFIHAQSLQQRHAKVIGMISLEMIGFFRDEKGSQHYPLAPLKLIYGGRGNYITLVSKMQDGKFSRKFSRRFKKSRTIRTKKFHAPAFIPGIDFSDHLNYWHFGYSALMITDTSFYRNENYHTPGDRLEALDFARMAGVVNGVYKALLGY